MTWTKCKGVLATAMLAMCSLGTVSAQTSQKSEGLAGNWVYRLGPNALFAFHLETEKGDPNRLHGYFLHPTNFNISSPGGSIWNFSGITNQSERESVFATGWQNDSLRLEEDAPTKKPEERGVYFLQRSDATHVSFTLFPPPLPPFRMEQTREQPLLADNWDVNRTYSEDDFLPDNPQMAQIVAADQADRKDGNGIDWSKVNQADEERRTAVAALLSGGKLHTGHDFESAALVFQHGGKPDDYLLAHALAIVAISKGQRGAVWISAATLDRYLQSIQQPQVFGTQFSTRAKEPSSQEPYNHTLISDSLRGYMGVPTESEQAKQRHQYDVERGIGAASAEPKSP